MSYTDDFWNALEEEQKKKKKKNGSSVSTQSSDDDIAPVRTAVSEMSGGKVSWDDLTTDEQKTIGNYFSRRQAEQNTTQEDDSLLDLFDAGALKAWGDGKADWDDLTALPKAILGTAGDAVSGVTKGFGSFAEGIADTIGYGIYEARKAFGETEADLADFKKRIADSTMDAVFGSTDEYLDDYSVLGRTSNSLAQGVGQLIPMMAGGEVLGALGGMAMMGTSSFGGGMSEAYQGGATDEEAVTYGVLSAATEILFEKLFGGIKIKGFEKGLSSLDDVTAKAVSKFAKSQTGKNVAEALVKGGFEGLEELGTGAAQALAKKATYMSEEDLLEILGNENLFEQFFVGMLVGDIAQVGNLNVANKTGRDFVTGNTQNEQAVIDKEVEDRIAEAEKDGKKLSGREKTKIYDDVVRDMERGYISTDTIEEVLGDKSSYDSLAKEAEEYDTLYNTATGQLSKAQQDRLAELESKNKANPYKDAVKTAKDQYSQSVFEMVKGDRLVESYNERARVGEDFQADLNKYKGTKHEDAAKKTIENAIKAGANNTNRVHDLVDMVAKTSADTGKVFTFKSGEQITADFIERQTNEIAKLESIEQRTAEQDAELADMKKLLEQVKNGDVVVDGDITSDGIVLNLDSNKPLNRVVGHEITHSFEPEKGKMESKEYAELRDSLFTYAKTKGIDIDSELKTRQLKYKGVANANAEAELVADLVGDFLFTDSDYVKSLSVENRNVFQKMWDEIKYLCKVATAGSKEARELARVEKAFADAYREAAQNREANEAGDTDTKYSIREADPPKETGVAYKVFFVKDGKLYPPMVANPEGADTPIGVWLDADVGTSAPPSKTGRAQVKAGGKGTQGGSGSLAFRPGWHLGDLPRASQFDRVNPETGKKELFPENFVWAEVEYAKDVDYQEEAMSYGYTENGKFRHAYAGLPRLPENGYYRYRTNPKPDTVPWIITGAMKVNRLLSDAEVNQILEQNGVAPVHRQGGDVGLDKFGFDESGNVKPMNKAEEVQYSLSRDTVHMDRAIAKNESSFLVDKTVMADAKAVRERIASKMKEIKDKGLVALPEDVEGNTYIANSSYDGTEENTTICPRSLASEAFVDAVSEYLGRPLTVEEQIYISQDLQGRSLTPECTYCYVATDRKAYRAFLGEYISQRDAVLQKVKDNPNADVSRSGDLYKEFLNGRKDTKPMYSRFKMWVDAYKNGTPMLDASHLANINKLMGDINSEFGADLKPQIVDAMKYAQSASWAKKRVNYVAYNGHILNWKQDRINKLNSHYGLRMYSFSDFHPAFVLENMQMITDASVQGLKMLGYTKDIDFVEIFAPSGMNINVSTFGFETDGNVYENNIIGAEWEKAKALREQYPNVGITFVATNDNLVNWALEQDWIDVVIPYHLVRTGAEVAKAFNYTNYTSESSDTKTKEWTKGDKKYIAPTEHNNDLATYLSALEKNHLKPRFERFIDNPNYMKLVNESRQPASQSKPVQPIFNEEAAMSALAKLEANGYYQPIGGSVDRMYEIAAEVAENMMQELAPTKHSLSEQGEEFAPIGKNDFFGKDFRKQSADDIAPVAETAVPSNGTVDNVVDTVEDAPVVEDDIAPVAETVDAESVMVGRDGFMSQKAMELYKEITSLKKGVRASKSLGYLLDHGHDWRSIKTALLNIRDNPNQVVNPNSAAETVAREMLGREYDDMVAELAEPSDVAESIRIKMQHIQTEISNNERLREQSNMDYDSEIAEVQAEYDAKKNKNTIVANDLLRRIERLNRMKNTNDANYAKRISDLEARIEKMSQPTYKRAVQRKAKQTEYTNLMKNLVGDTSTWVDKKLGISYKVNTLRRNLRDVVRDANGNRDIAKADAIYDELQGKYNHNEAELKRESRRIKAVFADLNLNHAEDTYAHMLGEFRHNPDSKLTEETVKEFYNKHKNSIDTAKVEQAIDESRKTFDELIVRVNERLKEQGMKEIPYRQGYFPHFTNPKQGWLAKLLNWKTVDTEIPTSIAGITETFNPERSWQGFSKQRKSDTTDYSLEQGLDTYIHGALDWIYHIEDIQKRRALENHIRYIHSEEGIKAKIEEIRNNEEYDADEAQKQIDLAYKEANNPLNNFVTNLRAGTNTLANKKSENDRQMESDFNRHVYSVMTNLNNRINANMVVGSVSSALTNFIPITQSWMEVSPVYSLRGMKDTIKSTIRDDGIISKSDFLTNRLLNEENLHQTAWDKISDKAAFMMEAIDSFTSQTVWRSKYLQNISEGMSETEAIKNADQFAENVIAGRSRGNQPTIFDAKNPLTKIFTAFQLEVSNQYQYMFKDAPQDSKNKARLVKGYATAFLGAYVYNALYSSLVGRDAAFDPIGILEDLFRDMGLLGDDEEEEPEDILLNLGENIIQEVPFIGGLFGGGRIPLSSAIPYGGDIKTMVSNIAEGEFNTKEWLKPIYYLALPVAGGQIKKTNEGLGMFSDEHPIAGSYTDSGNLRFPVEDTLGNRIQAGLFGQYASENARDYFDNGRSPLKEKQIQEYIDVDIPIRDYWEYREGLADQKTIEDKFDYIAGLDLPVAKKNILINNIVEREEAVDLEGYEDFSGYEEFDFATKNPGKYAVSQAVGGYDSYTSYMDELGDIEADKDENGKSISGSKKEKVIEYINNLDLDYGQKIILFKSMYDSKEDRNNYNADIVEYLDSRDDISYEDMVTILTELGMRVEGNNVYWD